MVRLTIRATNESVPPILLKLMEERISAGYLPIPEKREASPPSEISGMFRNIMVRDD